MVKVELRRKLGVVYGDFEKSFEGLFVADCLLPGCK